MKHTHISICLVITFLSSIVPGCRKIKWDKTPRYYSFSAKAMEYLNLGLGKYLIYKDSATSQLDSVIVTKRRTDTIFTPEQTTWGPSYDQSFQLILTKFEAASQSEWFNAEASTILFRFSQASSDTFAVDLRESDFTSVFWGTESNKSNYSITIEGKTYNNVIVTTYNNGYDISSPNYKKTAYYWAKGVGIIKRMIITTGGANKTHTLIRNN